MGRKSSTSIKVDPNVRCLKIYPKQGSKKSIEELKTVGMKLTKEQAIHFARVLLSVCQEWEEIEITGYRFEKRKADNTYHITVTNNTNNN